MATPTVFISYSHRDEKWKDLLLPHLQTLEQQGAIVLWDDRKIGTGEDWYQAIKRELSRTTVAVCLISADYLSSDFINKEEIPQLNGRRQREGMLLLPILVRPCPWKTVQWLKSIQMFPRDGKSLAEIRGKTNQEKALSHVAEYIYNKVEDPEFQLAKPPPTWAKLPKGCIAIERLPVTGAELFGRQNEMQLLDEAWESDSTHIVSLVAWGGVGKSTLVNKWLEQMAGDNYRGARRVYTWSFYSQGTGERVSSADLFINEALTWFGDPDPTEGSPWDRGQRLADLVCREKTLLLLDGLEPLQSHLDYERGKIRDPALAILLVELARHNPGLCVITTREKVGDLVPFPETVHQENLDQITAAAGRALLRVGGAQGTDADLEQAARDFGCHALALNLLAAYLHNICGHHVSNASEIRDLPSVSEKEGKHSRRVMAAFASSFGERQEVELLRMLGLFDRPASEEEINALRAMPAQSGLNEHSLRLCERDWLLLIEKLRWLKLIAPQSQHQPATLDCHPLVREHFAQQLRDEHPDAWGDGHFRLYEHLSTAAREYPNTIEQMMPLYEAVAHGCQAELHQEVLDLVYWERILRGRKAINTNKLGAFGADLTALSSFFDHPWDQPVTTLREADKAFVLNEAGYDLRALGRLPEATQPLQAALEAEISQNRWKRASIAAGNLSELYLAIGNLPHALQRAEEAFQLSDEGAEWFEERTSLAILGTVLHQAGRLAEAEDAFREAEALEGARLRDRWFLAWLFRQDSDLIPLLYSSEGFQFCDLLITLGKFRTVEMRIGKMLDWAEKYQLTVLTTALIHLSLGQIHLIQAQLKKSGDFAQASGDLEKAMRSLREAGHQEFIVLGLMSRAELCRATGDMAGAERDLDEAMSIATRGAMRLHEADCHLETARLYLAMGNDKEKVRESLARARTMIEKMGYHRRDVEVLLATVQLHLLEGDKETAQGAVAAAKKTIDETGCHRWDTEIARLKKMV